MRNRDAAPSARQIGRPAMNSLSSPGGIPPDGQTCATEPRMKPGAILAIDPGNEHSGWVVYDGSRVRRFGYDRNEDLLPELQQLGGDTLAIEMIASYGMPVGREVFETCMWIGRFVQAWCGPHELVYRRDVKLHLCGQARAKDAHIRQSLIDRFGPGKEKAIGTKKSPGPLLGVSGDVWSALAVAVTWSDLHARKKTA